MANQLYCEITICEVAVMVYADERGRKGRLKLKAYCTCTCTTQPGVLLLPLLSSHALPLPPVPGQVAHTDSVPVVLEGLAGQVDELVTEIPAGTILCT